MRTFRFNTGVHISNNSNMLNAFLDGNGVWYHAFDCEDVPKNATLMYLCDNNKLHENDSNVICRKVHNTKMISDYAYFKLNNKVGE